MSKLRMRTYFQPTTVEHCVHAMSSTVCRPVVIRRSSRGPLLTFVTVLNR